MGRGKFNRILRFFFDAEFFLFHKVASVFVLGLVWQWWKFVGKSMPGQDLETLIFDSLDYLINFKLLENHQSINHDDFSFENVQINPHSLPLKCFFFKAFSETHYPC